MRLLIFTKTTGYRHESIAAGALTVRELSRELGVDAEATEDADHFAPQRLARFGAVVWLSTRGTPSSWGPASRATQSSNLLG
jgi:uncharacterized protein